MQFSQFAYGEITIFGPLDGHTGGGGTQGILMVSLR